MPTRVVDFTVWLLKLLQGVIKFCCCLLWNFTDEIGNVFKNKILEST